MLKRYWCPAASFKQSHAASHPTNYTHTNLTRANEEWDGEREEECERVRNRQAGRLYYLADIARIVFCRRLQLKDLVYGLGKAVKVSGVLFTLRQL